MEDEESIGENQINREATEKLRKQLKYQNFMAWLKDNGALIDSRLSYPTAFGPNACIGVSCSSKIEPFQAIIAIPRKLIIDTDKVKRIPEFASIIQENPRMFSNRDQTDTAFNTLSLFLIYEKLKGNKSFYWPYFQVCECKNLLMDWNKAELEQIQNREIVQEIQQYKEDAQLQFMNFLRIIRKYDKVFPSDIKNEAYKKVFEWAHQFVMTRAFGWSVPWASLIPFADMLNHGQPHLDHFIIDLQKQKEELAEEKSYIQKKLRCNMGLFKCEYLKISPQQLKLLKQKSIPARRKYILKHQKLVDGDPLKIEQTKAINHIIHQQYNAGVHTLRQLNFADSSCSEDNDTDSDEVDEFVSKQYNFVKDDKAILKGTNKTPLKSSIKRYWDIYAEEKHKGKGKKAVKKPQEEDSEEEEEQISEKSRQSQESQSSSSEQQDWTWIDSSKEEDVHFVLFTRRQYSKNEQIYNFYGRRTNKFLLLGYNFATMSNKYDSFSFRMMVDPLSSVKPIVSKIVYSRLLNLKDRQGAIKTRQLRIKRQRICIELIDHCRCILLPVHSKQSLPLPITIPTSLPLEQSVLNLAKDILKYQLSQFYFDVEQDQQVIAKKGTAPRIYTAAVLRLSYKVILKEQVRLLDKCLEYLGRWKKGKIQLQEKEMGDVGKVKEYLYELERSGL